MTGSAVGLTNNYHIEHLVLYFLVIRDKRLINFGNDIIQLCAPPTIKVSPLVDQFPMPCVLNDIMMITNGQKPNNLAHTLTPRSILI